MAGWKFVDRAANFASRRRGAMLHLLLLLVLSPTLCTSNLLPGEARFTMIIVSYCDANHRVGPGMGSLRGKVEEYDEISRKYGAEAWLYSGRYAVSSALARSFRPGESRVIYVSPSNQYADSRRKADGDRKIVSITTILTDERPRDIARRSRYVSRPRHSANGFGVTSPQVASPCTVQVKFDTNSRPNSCDARKRAAEIQRRMHDELCETRNY